jgi:flagellar protein FliT
MKDSDSMSTSEALAGFEYIAQVTAEMVEAARAGEWEKLAGLERHCAAKVAQIRAMQPVRLPSEMQRQKIELIRKILANDAEIRNFTEPWMERLWSLLGSSRMARQVGKAYDSSAFE